jgi:hypothetical protein
MVHLRAACVVGHRAKDELTTASRLPPGESNGFACPHPIAARPVQTIVLTRTAAERFEKPPKIRGRALATKVIVGSPDLAAVRQPVFAYQTGPCARSTRKT